MIINYTPESFTLVSGSYYSPAFKQSAEDTLVTAAVWLGATGTVSIEASINQIDWIAVADTTFNCTPAGLQTYIDCHLGLVYRLVASAAVTKAQILI